MTSFKNEYLERRIKEDEDKDFDTDEESRNKKNQTTMYLEEEELEEPTFYKPYNQFGKFENQFYLMPVVDSITEDPLPFVLKKLELKWVIKEPMKLSESRHIFSERDVFLQPSYVGRGLICVSVSFDSDPFMIFEEVFYQKGTVNSGLLAYRKAWIIGKKKNEKQKEQSLPSKIVCFKTKGMSFEFQG